MSAQTVPLFCVVPQEGQVFVCGVNYREEDFMMQEEDEV